jgi:MFS family permease
VGADSASSGWRGIFRGNILFLGLVSFFTDVSSEAIYPLLPIFFTGLVSTSAAAIYIGLMDGIAESTSSFLKILAGRLSDRMGRRKPLALAGYGISTLARPAMALALAGWQVIALRFLDRVGKGLRTSPRDALISESVHPDIRGLAFSFHRLMDHAGAVLGPVLAALFLYALLGGGLLWERGGAPATSEEMAALRLLFALALIPGLLAMFALGRYVRESFSRPGRGNGEAAGHAASASVRLPSRFYVFLAAVTLFTLGNSSDLFLVFYARTRFGLGLGWVIVLWVTLHLSKMAFSLPGGRLSDLAGRRTAIAAGWAVYTAVYLALPLAPAFWTVWLLLAVYGLYYGLTEGAERALVADFVPSAMRGRAYGLYHGAIGLAALPASLLFGVFWAALGAPAAFIIAASLAGAALLMLLLFLAGPTGPGAGEIRAEV